MPIAVLKIKMHPGADREQFGQAALGWCRSIKSVEDARGRFYWAGVNAIGFVIEAPTARALNMALGYTDEPVPAELLQATFVLADLGDTEFIERWGDPQVGEARYRAAGR
jgi:hypothetical protein